MTITIPTIWVPIVVSIVLFILGIENMRGAPNGWFGDIGSFFVGVVLVFGIVLTWTSYYTMLYFLR